MPNRTTRTRTRWTLACSCEAEVLAKTILMLPRHHVVRIVSRGPACGIAQHARGRRTVVRSEHRGNARVFRDIRDG